MKAVSAFESQKLLRGRKTCYEGRIHVIKKDRVLLKFNDGLQNNYNSEDYEITFHFSRVPLRKQHHAIELVWKNLPMVLFPKIVAKNQNQVDVELINETGELRMENNSTIPWFNDSLNIVQKRAVANILQGVARPLPYVIFGPPG